MLPNIILFLIGLFILLLGSRELVRNALILTGKIRISPLVIGFTVVAIGTSLPEIFVALQSGFNNTTELSLGDIIGSNIANIGLIFGIALIFRSIDIGKLKTQKNMIFYLFLSTAFFLILLLAKLQVLEGLLLLSLGILAIFWQVRQGKNGALEEDKEALDDLSKDHRNPLPAVLLFALSLPALLVGSKLLVDSGIELAHLFGVSSFLVGIIAVSIGTSLPELVVTITSLAKKEEKLAVGNILGSNIYNILFGGGILGVFNAKGVSNPTVLFFFAVFSLFFCFLIYTYKGRRVPQYFGLVLLTGFIIYLWLMLIGE